MGRAPIRAKLVLDAETRAKLEVIAKSRTEGQARIERAKVLLAYHAGERVTALAEAFHTNRPKIERILNRALELLAGLDLLTGKVHACIEERHRSLDFTKLLEKIHQAYSPETRILMVMDNHSAHISKATQAYLRTRPNRFEFVFTPKPVRRNNMDSSSHNGIRSLDSRQRMRCLVGRKCEAEVFMLFRHGP